MRAKAEEILSRILKGELTVRWAYWFFSGGRTFGDGHSYNIFKNGILVYTIDVNETNGLDIHDSEGNTICYALDVGDLVKTAYETLLNAVERDDKEIVKALSDKDGKFLGLPRDYGDITREDVLEGRWSVPA